MPNFGFLQETFKQRKTTIPILIRSKLEPRETSVPKLLGQWITQVKLREKPSSQRLPTTFTEGKG
jgi:hypothetical protein